MPEYVNACRRGRHVVAAARVLLLLGLGTFSMPCAADYPERLLKAVVPYPAGSAVDVVARTLFARLAANLGHSVIVENRVGANGNVGMAAAAKAPKDGYTLLFTPTQIASNPGLGPVDYDPVKDFAPIVLVSRIPALLVVPAASSARSVADLVALARAKPGALSYASGGHGGIGHFSGESLKALGGNLDVVHVPYKSAAEQVASVLREESAFAFPAMSLALPHITAGKLRVLATTGASRHSLLPNVPTINEALPPGFVLEAWYGLLAPAGVPPEVVLKLNAEMIRLLRDPAIRETLVAASHDIVGSTPAEFAEVIRQDVRVWGDLAKKLGVKVD